MPRKSSYNQSVRASGEVAAVLKIMQSISGLNKMFRAKLHYEMKVSGTEASCVLC